MWAAPTMVTDVWSDLACPWYVCLCTSQTLGEALIRRLLFIMYRMVKTQWYHLLKTWDSVNLISYKLLAAGTLTQLLSKQPIYCFPMISKKPFIYMIFYSKLTWHLRHMFTPNGTFLLSIFLQLVHVPLQQRGMQQSDKIKHESMSCTAHNPLYM